ncbi:hypothetical protein WA1_28395 [Scytonema hofmannii PCC 7110]|uniref:Uncharacterized protein n=1 Tax=Scytonema hofmannii PCC 7110 TaxID=128403 RepID=A0A139X5J5_9CYAN|nr:DUF6658 family protein [Scytonema hofmannii]KYC39892.1 hypothetical protein WA1_28395 [Scytonema hofmannii PCC 7110]
MNRLTAFLNKLRLRQILTVLLAGLLLIVSTACNSADVQGANPKNPPVQAGGANNPYKGGGDKSTNSKMSKSGLDQANLQLKSPSIIATSVNKEVKLYPGAETPEGRAIKEAELPIKSAKDFQQPEPGGLIQRDSGIVERAQNRLETVGKAFQDASEFIQDKGNEAGKRPEAQPNPAVGK